MSEARQSYSPLLALIVGVVVLALGTGGVLGYRAWRKAQQAAQLATTRQDAEAAIAERVGIRVTRVVVTADGGLVDLRYQVLDPDKASFLFEDLSVVPKLIAEDGTLVSLNSNPHRHSVQAGITYFLLYRNVGGSVKPGSQVTILIGDDLRLPGFTVEK